MKKFTILLLFVLFIIASCKKENTKDIQQPDKISVEGAPVISKGDFVFLAESNAGGQVKIYRLQNGKYVLGLEQMNFSTNKDVELYLSKTPALSSFSIKLFSFKSVNGTLYYELPSHITIADFKYVIIQNDTEQEAIASAELQ